MEGDETTSYVISHAKIHKQTAAEAVGALVKHIDGLFRRVREVLGQGVALNAFESVVAGFVQYHLQTERYKLAEILPEYNSWQLLVTEP